MPPVAAPCPPLADFERLLSGDSAPDDVNRLAGHLEGCAKCTAAIQTLLSQDTLGSGVRGAARPSVLEKLPAALASKLLALREGTGAPPSDEAATLGAPARANLEDTLGAPALAPALAPDELGRLGGYRVLQVLGEGGMGLVYLAEDVQLLRRVALKVMKPDLAKNDSARLRFLAEARAAAKVRSDHVVTIFQTGEDCGTAYAAMELLRGAALDSWIKKNRGAPMSELMRIGRETALGLAAAHEEGLIHRDIKPANIWVEASGRIKILDFGLARPAEGDAHLTKSGAVVGTPAYMAPEQARGMKVDHRADLFSLGCVLHRLCTGEMPFKGDTVMAVLTALAVENPPPANELNANVPPRLAALITALLSKDANKRPQSAVAVADELQAIIKEQTGGGTPTVVYVPAAAPVVLPLEENNSAFDFGGDTEAVAVPRPAAQRPRRRTPEPDVPDADSAEPEVAGSRKSRKPLILAAVALLGIALASVAAVLVFSTKNGTLTVQIEGKDADVRFKNGKLEIYDDKGTLKYTLEPNKKEASVAPGKYTVKVTGADGLKLDTEEFVMTKGGKALVTVRASGPGGVAGGGKKDTKDQNPPLPPGGPRLALSAQTKVVIPDVGLDVTKPFTVEAYLTPFVGYWERASRPAIADQNGAFGIDIFDGQFEGYTHHGRAKGGTARPGERAHVALVMVADQRRLFVNGKLVHAMPGTFPPNGPGSAPIGLSFNQPHGEVLIEELRVSKVARYEADFAPAAQHTPDKDTLALFHGDEGAGDTLKDSSGNKKHGVITNPRWVKPQPVPPVPASAAPPLQFARGTWPVGPAENVMGGLAQQPALVSAFGRWQLIPTAIPLGGSPWSAEPAFSPDGTKVAIPDQHYLRIYDANTGALVGLGKRNGANPLHGGEVRAEWSHDSKWVRMVDRRGNGADNASVWTADGAPAAAPWQPHASVDFGWNPQFPVLAYWPHGADKMHIVDPASTKPLELDFGANPLRGGQWSPDGNWLLLIREDKSAQLFARDGKPWGKFAGFEPNAPVAWGKAGDALTLAAPVDGVVHVWKGSGDLHFKTPKFEKRVTGVSWKPDGTVLAVSDEEGKRHFFAADGKSIAVVETKEGDPRTLWVKDSDAFIVGGKHWPALAPASADLRRTHWYESFSPDLSSVAFNTPGRVVVEAFDAKKGTTTATGWQAPRTGHAQVVWSPDGKKLALTSHDGTTVYDARDAKKAVRLGGGTAGALGALAVSPKADRFAVAAHAGHVHIVGTDGKVQRVIPAPPVEWALANPQNELALIPRDVRWHPDGKHFAVVRGSFDVTVYDADTGAQVARTRPAVEVRPGGSALFSPTNPDVLLLAHPDNSIAWRWRAEKDALQKFPGLGALWANADGKKLLAQPATVGAAVVDASAFEKRDTTATDDIITKGNVPAPPVAWHPDGKHLLVATHAGIVEVRGPDGKVVADLRGDNLQHGTFVSGAPTGAKVPVKLGGEFAVIDLNARAVYLLPKTVRGDAAALAPDGKHLLAITGSTVNVWNLETNELDRAIHLLPDGESFAFTVAGELVAKTAKADAGFRYAVEDKDARVTARTAAEVAADLAKVQVAQPPAPKPAGPRWPLKPTPPDEIKFFLDLGASVWVRDATGDKVIRANSGVPAKPVTLVGIDFWEANAANVDDAVLRRLAQLTDIEIVRYHFKESKGAAATTAGTRELGALVNVRRALLASAVQGGADYSVLAKFKQLEALEVPGAPGSAWVPHVAGLPALSELAPWNSALTEAELEQLAKLPRLTSLNLHNPGLSEAALRAFAKKVPWCRVVTNEHGKLTIEPTVPHPLAGLRIDEVNGGIAAEVPGLLAPRDGPFTVEGYAKFDRRAMGANPQFFGWTYQFVVGANGEGYGVGYFADAGKDAPKAQGAPVAADLPRGQWHHIAAVRDGKQVRLYLNGALASKFEVGAPLRVPTADPATGVFVLGNTCDGVTLRDVRVSGVARYGAEKFAPAARLTADKDTLGLYACDEGAGDVIRDSSGNNKHGKVVSGTWARAGAPAVPKPVGGALRFAEPAAGVSVPTLKIPREGPYTLEGYVTLKEQGYVQHRVIFGSEYQFALSGQTGTFNLWGGGGGKYTNASVDKLPDPQKRFHVACVRTETEHLLFVDGKRVAKSDLLPMPPTKFQIGALMAGDLSEIRVSSVARYKGDFAPAARFETDKDTVALYHCDDGKGDVLTDSSGNKHHGTIVGGTWAK